MKKILVFIMVLVISVSACGASVFAAVSKAEVGAGIIAEKEELSEKVYTTKEGYMYRLRSDNTAVVCGAPEDSVDVVIPSEVDGHKVTGVSGYAQKFQGAAEAKSLTVSEGVLTIGSMFLYNFKKAEEINLPSSLVDIVYQDFIYDIAYYKNPDNWDNGVLYIGTNLMAVKQDVPETLVVREGTTCVSQRAVIFTDTVIKEVVFPKTIPHGLEYLTINTVEKGTVPVEHGVVADRLFSGCEKLTDVKIEDGITAIGERGFTNCKSLTSIEIPETVTKIGAYAFATCEGLKKIYVPSSVTEIGEYAFGYEGYLYHDRLTGERITKYRHYNFVLCGEIGSAAHRYALENMITFEATTQMETTNDECFGKRGDSNIDRTINVKDATAIQKHLADLTVLSDSGLKLADADSNDTLNIKDVTAIQKYVAGMDTGLDIGEMTDIRL
ncbi:MAG: leucine-rich repeat protein [Ruminococcus sp.]|nr:leucine-rich repeat protein [Ruminococcus sp.]